MTQNPSASEWVAARGDKWRAQLAPMEAMLRPIDEPLIRALRLEAPCRIVDVGCGGGGTALEIARRAPAGSTVHGVDISPALIDLARTRAGADAHAVTFQTGDASKAMPGAPHDRMVSRFGIMFFDDPAAAFVNLARWLAPRGRFAFAVWGPPAENGWLTSVRHAVAAIVDLPPSDPEAPGPFRYADSARLLPLLERAGLGDLDVRHWRGALPIGGRMAPAEAADFALAAFSSFGELLAKAGQGALDEARRSLTARLAKHETNGAVYLDASVHIVTGIRSPQ